MYVEKYGVNKTCGIIAEDVSDYLNNDLKDFEIKEAEEIVNFIFRSRKLLNEGFGWNNISSTDWCDSWTWNCDY